MNEPNERNESHATHPAPLSRRDVIRGAALMAEGVALAAVGIPMLVAATGCSVAREDLATVTAIAQVSIPSGASVVAEVETHDSSGSGVDYYAVRIPSGDASEFAASLDESDAWSALPLPAALETAFYGPSGSALVSPTNDEDFIPQVSEGYYLFVDRNANASDDQDVAEAFAHEDGMNFTLGLYDTAGLTLYLYVFDS